MLLLLCGETKNFYGKKDRFTPDVFSLLTYKMVKIALVEVQHVSIIVFQTL